MITRCPWCDTGWNPGLGLGQVDPAIAVTAPAGRGGGAGAVRLLPALPATLAACGQSPAATHLQAGYRGRWLAVSWLKHLVSSG